MKKLKISILTLLSIIIAVNFAKSQCIGVLPTVNDNVAKPNTTPGPSFCPAGNPVTTTSHTGTDAYFDGTNHCVVNVWDEFRASFSWRYYNATTPSGSVLFTAVPGLGVTLKDPDVVIQELGVPPVIYAMFVGEVTSGPNNAQIYYGVYSWSVPGSTFNYVTGGFLGNVLLGVCKNPNIDQNHNGQVAITWEQDTTIVLQIAVTNSAPYNFPPTNMNVLRAGVFGAYGQINGTGCNGTGVVRGFGGTTAGDFISTPSAVNHLFEANTRPDVSIAENNNVFYTYLQTWFDPATFSFVNQLIVKEYLTPCTQINTKTQIFNTLGRTGYPRIASRPDAIYPNDYQVVMGNTNQTCTCPILYDSRILSWGVHNGTVLLAPSGIAGDPFILTQTTNSPCNLNPFWNDEPVVSFVSPGLSTTGDYVVAWTHGADYSGTVGVANTVLKDIIARTYNSGLPIATATRFSIVNKNNCSTPTFQENDQTIPSIAARYINSRLSLCWWDQDLVYTYHIAHKLTPVGAQAGTIAALREQNAGEPGNTSLESSFNALPNPFKNEISFEFSLATEEHPVSIEITDAKGASIEKISVTHAKSSYTWKPANLNAGIYFVKLITTNGEYFTKISKE